MDPAEGSEPRGGLEPHGGTQLCLQDGAADGRTHFLLLMAPLPVSAGGSGAQTCFVPLDELFNSFSLKLNQYFERNKTQRQQTCSNTAGLFYFSL